MIIALFVAFFFGAAFAGSAVYLYNDSLKKTMLADAKVALERQHEDSFAAGYMCGYKHCTRKSKSKTTDTIDLIPALV